MNRSTKNNDSINLLDLFFYLLSKWKWFLLFAIIGVVAAYAWYSSSEFTYFKTATITIKDPENKTYSAGLNRYDNLINKVNVTNEIYRFRSHKLMKEVVTRTHADVNYKQANRLRYLELYTQAPVTVSFPSDFADGGMSFDLTVKKDSLVRIAFGESKAYDVKLGDTLDVAGTQIIVTPTNYYGKSWYDKTLLIQKVPVGAAASYFVGRLGVRQESEEASILKLSIQDASPYRAAAVLNMLIQAYNEDVIREKNQVAINTADFINERLIIIENELGGVESDLEAFKRSNQILSMESESGSTMGDAQKYGADAIALETQISLAKYIQEYLNDPSKDRDLIPANTGLENPSVVSQIEQYNTIKLRRDKLIEEGSEQNPIVQELNNSLTAMKQSIVRSVDNMIVNLETRYKDAVSQQERARTRVLAIPQKERELLSIERQQQIKESLYLFLLNRREENALSQAMVDNNAQIINETSGSDRPIAPDRTKVLLLGLLLGLAAPAVWFLMKLFLDTRVQTRRDIKEAISVPFLGEIPLDKEHMKRQGNPIVVTEGEHTQSEAFRILRTNMAFMKKKDQQMQVITFTSFNESAGKTFVSSNLAVSFAMAKKKTVVVDLDIRKGTLTGYLGGRHMTGVTNYLYDADVTVDDIIVKAEKYKGLDFIPAGSKAPNPAELLMDERLDQLIEELRKRYEFIVVDNVPVGIIADATVSNRIADLTVFVVRAGKMDRRQLPELQELYDEKTLANMAVVLNGSEYRSGGYGYVYGYGYGYGYGEDTKKKSWRRKRK